MSLGEVVCEGDVPACCSQQKKHAEVGMSDTRVLLGYFFINGIKKVEKPTRGGIQCSPVKPVLLNRLQVEHLAASFFGAIVQVTQPKKELCNALWT